MKPEAQMLLRGRLKNLKKVGILVTVIGSILAALGVYTINSANEALIELDSSKLDAVELE